MKLLYFILLLILLYDTSQTHLKKGLNINVNRISSSDSNNIKDRSINTQNKFLFNKKRKFNYSDLFQVKTKQCKKECFKQFGDCNENNICICKSGYINLPNANPKYAYLCSYKMKKENIAILLEALTFIGGDLYLGFILYALIKVIFVILLTLFFHYEIPCVILGCEPLLPDICFPVKCIKIGDLMVMLLLIIIWEINDIIIFMGELAVDHRGIPLHKGSWK